MERTAIRTIGLVMLLAVGAILAIVVSRHVAGNHVGEMYSSMDIYHILEAQVTRGGNDGPCAQMIVASCPLARVEDRTNPRYGQLSPHLKALCQLRKGDPKTAPWAMGIIGLSYGPDQPVYVTGYVTSYQAAEQKIKRDRCAQTNVTVLEKMFGSPLKPIR